MHKMDPSNKNKLDSKERRKVLPPEETLNKFSLKEQDIFADIGCGIGYFTIPASKIIATTNTAYAMDISQEMLDELKNRAQKQNIKNIEILKTDEYGLKLDKKSVTYVLICNVLHEVEEKEKLIREAARILKDNGKILIIEWDKKETPMGPAMDHRISREEVKRMIKKSGLSVKYEDSISNIFYGIIAEK